MCSVVSIKAGHGASNIIDSSLYLQITSEHTQLIQLCMHKKNIHAYGRARHSRDPWIAVLSLYNYTIAARRPRDTKSPADRLEYLVTCGNVS